MEKEVKPYYEDDYQSLDEVDTVDLLEMKEGALNDLNENERKTFIEIIAHIQAQQRRDSEISQLLGGIADETAVYITQLVTNLVITLEDEFNDADQTISWWLWDAPHAGEVPESCCITDEKRRKEWHITDAGKLYDYLVEML